MSDANPTSGRFHLSKRVYAAILLLVVIIAGVTVYVYYAMSVDSVTNVRIDQVLGDRKLLSGTYPNRNATFLIEVKVWSAAQSLSVKLDNPLFLAVMDGVRVGNQTLDSGTILPGSYVTYNLRFNVVESKAGYVPFNLSANNVHIGMITRLTAGLYSQPATIVNAVTWNWTTALPIIDFGSCNNCVV